MRQVNLSKMYEKLTIKEQADLAFRAICESDLDTLKNISRAVPQGLFRATEPEYQNRVDKLAHIGFLWLIQYWKLVALTGGDLLLLNKSDGNNHIVRTQLLAEAVQRLDTLKAHLLIFDGLEKNGIDKESMLKFCEDLDSSMMDEIKLEDLPDYAQEYYDETLVLYLSLMEQ